jgi:hypothetical protein
MREEDCLSRQSREINANPRMEKLPGASPASTRLRPAPHRHDVRMLAYTVGTALPMR